MESNSSLYHTSEVVFETEHDPENDIPPSKSIVDAVASAQNTSPIQHPPLYEFVDVEAVVALLEHDSTEPDSGTVLRFTVEELEVFVRADGRIKVCDRSESVEPRPVFND